MSTSDTYKTVEKSFEGEVFKDRGSKFIGYVFPITDEGDVRNHIDMLKSQHHKARHWCYAYKIGFRRIYYC